MNNLVFFENNQALTTSLIVAEGTENEHRSIIRLIQNYEKQFKRWGKIRFMDLKSTNSDGGRPMKVALLNEPQATFLISLLRNNEIVVAFKSELVAQFFAMRETLEKLGADEVQRLQLRQVGKEIGRKPVTEAIHLLNQRDFKDGDKDPRGHKRYAAYTFKTQIKTLGIPKGGRDAANGAQLAALTLGEKNSAAILNHALETGGSYRQAEAIAVNLFRQLRHLSDGQYSKLQLKESTK